MPQHLRDKVLQILEHASYYPWIKMEITYKTCHILMFPLVEAAKQFLARMLLRAQAAGGICCVQIVSSVFASV